MKHLALQIFFITVLAVLPCTSYAAPEDIELKSSDNLLNLCTSKDSDELLACSLYLVGFRHSLTWHDLFVVAMKNPELRAYCIPDEITNKVMREVVVQWVQGHPQKLYQPPFTSIIRAWNEKWPCENAYLSGTVSAHTRTDPQDEPLTVSITTDGSIYIQKTQIKLEELQTKLIAVAGENTKGRILIRADRSLDYGRVMQVVGEIYAAGFTNVSFVAQAAKQPTAQHDARRQD